MSCAELDEYINNIYEREQLETKQTKDAAEELYELALARDCSSLADATNLMGFLHYNRNEPIKAIYYLSKSDSIINAKGIYLSKASVRNKMYMGLTSHIGGNFKTAQLHFKKALEISEKISFPNGMLQAYLNQSLYYLNKKDVDSARNLLEKASQYNDGNKLMSGYVFFNLARSYFIECDFEESIRHSKLAEEIWTDLDFPKGLYFVNLNLASISLLEGDTLGWKSYLDVALFNVERQDGYIRHSIYHTLGWYYKHNNEDDLAIDHFEKALDQSASFEENELVNIVGALIDLYEKKGDVENIKRINKKAVDFFDKKSEIYSIEADKWHLKELTLENKIRENQFLKFRNKAFLISWISTVGIFVVFGFLLFKFFRQRAAKKRLEDAQEFRSMVSSNLHDNVGSTLAGLAMRSEVLSTYANEELKNELIGISETSREAMTSLRDTVWAVDIRKDTYENLINKMLEFAEDHLSYKNISFTSDIKILKPDGYIHPELRQNVYLIFKEAITNILKHSSGDSVHLKIRQNDKKFKMSIKDNGKSLETSPNAGSGLKNMKMRADKIGGELTIKTEGGYKVGLKVKS